jgi:hypothetical protein
MNSATVKPRATPRSGAKGSAHAPTMTIESTPSTRSINTDAGRFGEMHVAPGERIGAIHVGRDAGHEVTDKRADEKNPQHTAEGRP